VAHDTTAAWKRTLYARAARRPDELAAAAHALLGSSPSPDQHAEVLDFFVTEWVDAEGFTEVERAVDEGALPAEALRWPAEVRTAMWVVDGWEGTTVMLRDVASEDEIAVHAPHAVDDLPRRTVLRARVLPTGDTWSFSGEPDVWEPMGVLARMDLLRAWQETGAPDTHARLVALRAAFRRQREERDAFVAWFKADLVVFEDAAAMERALAPFVSHLENTWRFPSLAGRTRAEARKAAKGGDPVIVQLALGPTLTGPGRPGVIYDRVEGVHFLPSFGELRAHLDGAGSFPEVLAHYLEDPGYTALPFRRLRVPPELEAAVAAKAPSRVTPSVLPGFDD
jgi:hypothetical protein